MAGGTPLGQMYIELGLDVSKFNPTLNGAKNAVKYFQNNVRSLDSTLKGNEKNASLLQAKYKTLGQAIDSQRKVLDEMKKSFDKLDPGTANFDKAAADIQRENAKLAAMENQLRGVEKALQDIGRENSWAGKISNQLSKQGEKFEWLGGKLRGMGDAMRPVSTLVATGFTLATRKAIEFEDQMNTTKSLLADTVPTVEELNTTTKMLGESSKGWAKQYGISTASINEGMQEIIKKGFDANQTIAAMPSILDATKASGDDFNVVMNASTNILRQFELEAKDTGRVTDSLTYVANKTSAGFSDMGLAMEYIGPVAHSLGMSIEETSAAIGLLSDNGIAGEKAGTALRGALSKLLKPSQSNANAMRELGFSVEEFQSGALKLPDIIDRIKKSTEGWTDAEKSSAIARAFGIEAQTGMNALINQGGDALRNLTKQTENARGYTHKLARELMNSSKNGVERFKANLEVLQINIGQKLLPTLSPLIEKVNHIIESFSKASPEVQNFWIKVGLGAAVAYPALNMLGNFSTTLGGVFKIAGKGVELLNTARNISAVGTTAAEAGASVGLLSKAGTLLGLAFTPTGAVVLGTLAVGGAIAYFAHKAYEARQRAQEWGASVSVDQANQLQDFKDKVDEANHAMTDFGSGAASVNKVTESVKKLATEIQKLADENLAKDIDLAQKLGLSDEAIQALTEHSNQVKDNVQQMSDEVIKIYQNAANNHRKLSEEEKAIVLANQNELINTQLELMEYSGEERINMIKAFNGQADELNTEQLKKATELTEKWAKDEQASYQERLEGYKKLMAQINGEDEKSVKARAEIKAQIEQLEAEHTAKMEAYSQKWNDLQGRLLKTLQVSPEALTGIMNQLKSRAEEMGLTYDEMAIKFQNAFSKVQEGNSMWAQTAKDATESMKLANTQWNAMIWDEKTGQLKTNTVEEVQKALEAEGGWDAMQFILKEANLETNARLTVGEALVANGQWEKLSPEEKKLIVNEKPAVQAILDSKELMLQWNDLPSEVKEILGKNESFLSSAEGAKQALTQWNLMTPSEKALTLKDLASSDIKVVQGRIDMMTGKQLPIEAIDNTPSTVESVLYGVNSIRQHKPVDINATDLTGDVRNETSSEINAIKQNSPIGISAQNNTQGTVNQVQSGVDSIRDKTVTINAQDNASGVLSGIRSWINSVTGNFFTNIFASRHAHGTNYHPGGLAIVNDQRNSNYKEMVTLPDGRSFIPEGRDVLLPLPKGSKVLRADKTKRLMREMGIPKYATGVGIPSDAKFLREMEEAQRNITIQTTSVQSGQNTEKVVAEMRILRASLEKLLIAILNKDTNAYMDSSVVTDIITKKQREREKMTLRMKGVLE